MNQKNQQNPNINITGLNKQFALNNKTPVITDDTPYRAVITTKSFFSINESNIAYKINKLPYYSNYFSILDDYESLNISELTGDVFEKLKNNENNENMNYYLFKYNDKHSIYFIDYLYNQRSIKKLIFDMIDSFSHILHGLSILNQNNICFFNISSQNIIFQNDYREKPVLGDFRLGLQLNKLNYSYISSILSKLDDFTYQPLEIHILFHFINHKITTISYSFIEYFCETFVEHLNILTLFSSDYKKAYKEQCMETMKKYVNRSQTEIINDILERSHKWDVYGISVLYLKIFGCISCVFSLKHTVINKITMELVKNIHSDSNKRMSLESTIYSINKVLNETNDWNFINKMDNNKIERLFDEFSK